jgi:Protein of unknown function (DUF998)
MSGLLVAVAGTPGLRVSGYVSELGAQGAPWARTYRAAIVAIAVGLVLLAIVYRPVSAAAATLLVSAAVFGAVSASVRCTPGCPLPPEVGATPADTVHTGASITAFVLAAGAMLVLARVAVEPVARLCRYGIVLVVALGTPVGLGIVLVGRGLFTGVLERAMMAVAIAWLVGVSALAGLSRSPGTLRRGYRQPVLRDRTGRTGAAELSAQGGGADPREVEP